jgi:hypothetical protein
MARFEVREESGDFIELCPFAPRCIDGNEFILDYRNACHPLYCAAYVNEGETRSGISKGHCALIKKKRKTK